MWGTTENGQPGRGQQNPLFQDGLRLEEIAENQLQPFPSYAALLLSEEVGPNTCRSQEYFPAPSEEFLAAERTVIGAEECRVQDLHRMSFSQHSYGPSNSLGISYANTGPLWAMQQIGLNNEDCIFGEETGEPSMVEDDPMQLPQNPTSSASWQRWLEQMEHERDIARARTRFVDDYTSPLQVIQHTQEHDSGGTVYKESANSHDQTSYVVSPGALDFIEVDEM